MKNKKFSKNTTNTDFFRVCAVIVTFNPDIQCLRNSLKQLNRQVNKIIIVDNNSNNVGFIEKIQDKKITIIKLKDNTGIAHALNVGVKYALKSNPFWILTLDDDSTIYRHAIKNVISQYIKLDKKKRENIGILGISDKKGDKELKEVKFLITSGNLIRSTILLKTSFRDDLFIDLVDFEFDLSVRAMGYRILLYNTKLMEHKLGDSFEFMGKKFNFESPTRLYYITRNSTFLLTRYHYPIKDWLRHLIWYRNALYFLGVQSLPVLSYKFLSGLFDGIVGRLGKRG